MLHVRLISMHGDAFEHALAGVPPPCRPLPYRGRASLAQGLCRHPPRSPSPSPTTAAHLWHSSTGSWPPHKEAGFNTIQTNNNYKLHFNPHGALAFAGRHLVFSLPQQAFPRRPRAGLQLGRRGSR